MADFIPFINSGNDLKRLRSYYDRPTVMRIQLSNAASLRREQIQHACPIWIDPEIDGYHRILKRGEAWPEWQSYISQFKESEVLKDAGFLKKPDPRRVNTFVHQLLGECQKSRPDWITLPQLPVTGDSTRNKMNIALAKATALWRTESRFAGKFVLPLIFTHQHQLRGKTQWGPTLKNAKKCFDTVGPDVIWAVDSDLSDWKGSDKFRDRFASLVAFHTDLRSAFPGTKIVAGPYWGMNLVLWARGLCDHPAICLGHGFSYRMSGGYIPKEPPRAIVAIGPLRRLACYTGELEVWLEKAIGELRASGETAKYFTGLRSRFKGLPGYELTWNQAAEFYGQWLSMLETITPAGRSLALFQDLSSAYVLGKKLPRFPDTESPARSPGKIAELLMLHCL